MGGFNKYGKGRQAGHREASEKHARAVHAALLIATGVTRRQDIIERVDGSPEQVKRALRWLQETSLISADGRLHLKVSPGVVPELLTEDLFDGKFTRDEIWKEAHRRSYSGEPYSERLLEACAHFSISVPGE